MKEEFHKIKSLLSGAVVGIQSHSKHDLHLMSAGVAICELGTSHGCHCWLEHMPKAHLAPPMWTIWMQPCSKTLRRPTYLRVSCLDKVTFVAETFTNCYNSTMIKNFCINQDCRWEVNCAAVVSYHFPQAPLKLVIAHGHTNIYHFTRTSAMGKLMKTNRPYYIIYSIYSHVQNCA